MTLRSARLQVFSALTAAGFTKGEAAAAVAALTVAGPLAEKVAEWVPLAFASGAREPARDIVAAKTEFERQIPRPGATRPRTPRGFAPSLGPLG